MPADKEFKRNRPNDTIRPLSIKPGIAPNANGSVLCSFGNTQIICAATTDARRPRWMDSQGIEGGWMTAEYSMLPYSTHGRKQRDITRGKADGRTIEIQRLIGRSLRAVADLKKLTGHTLWIDCDVLQADGGTRTASITGAWVAAEIACRKLVEDGKIEESPFTDAVAAISVGICDGVPLLDLCYEEDRDATVDANIVMSGNGRFVEIQSSGEEATFSEDEFNSLLSLARKGICEIRNTQDEAVKQAFE